MSLRKVRGGTTETKVLNRFVAAKGTDIASASTITLPDDGNFFDITGTTAIKYITTTGITVGTRIILQSDGSVVVHDDEGSIPANTGEILLAAGGDYSMTAGDLLELIYDGTAWKEVGRTVVT